jgi:3-dehydroquinate synthase
MTESLVTFLDDSAEALGAYLRDRFPRRRPALCTDRALLSPLKPMLAAISKALPGIEVVPFPGGESRKDRRTKALLEDRLLKRGFGSDSILLALGGGTVTDLVGFTAGTFTRGVPYVNLPTTLLAMVDAAYGGKTAVNTPQGKNLVGMFHVPSAVLIPLSSLATLPDKEYLCGLAECIKHGLAADARHFEWVVQAGGELLHRDMATVRALVAESLALKLGVVSEDPLEESGRRNILNVGHTVGHALERMSRWRERHGVAVARGILWETAVAVHDGFLAEGEASRVFDGLGTFPFPRLTKGERPEAILRAAAWDKKNREGRVKYVPLGAVGEPALPPPHTADLTLEGLAFAARWVGGKR